MSNPLVAQKQDSTTALSGITFLEGGQAIKDGIESGDWASVAMGAVGVGLDAIAAVADPFGSILAAGVGWLMEHVGPLKEALDALAGDPDQITAHSETWKNIAKEVGDVSTDLANQVKADVQSWTGPGADAYRKQAEEVAKTLAGTAQACEGAASGVKTAGEVVAAVRMLVRDIIAQVVGHMVSWALQVLFTLGIGLIWVVPQVVSLVAKTAKQLAELIKNLTKALKALGELLGKASKLFADAGKALKGIKPSAKTTPSKIDTLPSGAKSDTVPSGAKSIDEPPSPGGGATPSGARGVDDVPTGTVPGGTASRGLDDAPTTPSGAGTRGATNSRSLADEGGNPRSPDNVKCEFDPIDVSTGQLVFSEIDAELAGVLPLVFERTHFSGHRAGRLLGGAWMSTADQRLEVYPGGIAFAAADGTIQQFAWPADDNWVLPEYGATRALARTPDGGYVIEDRDLGRVLYFAPGNGVLPLASVSDRNGNHYAFVRDDDGTPREIWHSGGHRVRFDIEDGRITALYAVAPDGEELKLVSYGYTDGNLTEVTNPSGIPFHYHYDRRGRIVEWVDRNGEWYRYHYDERGRVVRTEGSGDALTGTLEYDTANRITRTTDALGHTKQFHLNARNQVVREVNELGHATAYEWDAHDRLLRETDPLGRSTSFTYDELGNVVAVLRPDGHRIEIERDTFGLPVRMVEAPGVVVTWQYDDRGNVLSRTEPDGATTTYEYDGLGHLAAVTDPAGVTQTVACDAAGLPIAVTDAGGATTRYERDALGRLAAVGEPTGAVERFGYTPDGLPAWHQHADGTVERWIYDGEGNNRVHAGRVGAVTRAEPTHFDLPSSQVNPDGSQVGFSYDQQLRLTSVTNETGEVWRYEYDPAGNLVSETDFSGVTLSYRYDAAGQLSQVTNGAGETIAFTRNALGEVVESVAGGVRTRFAYDAGGHLLSVDDGTTRVEYRRDLTGRVLAESVNGRTVHSEYDAAGRRVRRVTPAGAETTWEYDDAGLPSVVRAGARSLRFEHDLAGRETRRVLGSGAALTQSWTPGGQIATQAVRGAAGDLRQERTYLYRGDGLPTHVHDRLAGPREFGLDELGRVTDVWTPQWTEQYAYDAAGRIAGAEWPSQTTADTRGARTMSGALVTAAGRERYTHDGNGRLIRREHENGATWHYRWDAHDHLVAVRTPEGDEWRYTYDPLGRRVRKEHVARDGATVVGRVDFVWDDQTLVEEIRSGPEGTEITVWDYELDGVSPMLQRQRANRGGPQWTEERFHAVVVDSSGAPAELLDEQGGVVPLARMSLFGSTVGENVAGADIPLRYPGQYFDAETGLHYNFHRYYDPSLARYLSSDPLGLTGGPDPQAYVSNPLVAMDPLGLKGCGNSSSGSSSGRRRRNTGSGTTPSLARRETSPGGSVYEARPPGGAYAGANRRHAAGYDNPSHSHSAMLPLWQRAAVSPEPPNLSRTEQRDWLMDPNRRFRATTPGGSDTGIITGHSSGVLGHEPSASTHWNTGGMDQTRASNFSHNRETSTYHGIEDRGRSDASGASEPRYTSPGPSSGGHRSYWDRQDPGFSSQGGPWSSWEKVPPPSSSTRPPASSSSSSRYYPPSSYRPPTAYTPSGPGPIRRQSSSSGYQPYPSFGRSNSSSGGGGYSNSSSSNVYGRRW
ncbi:RHS repeat-associated core domain-containing protein [Amycolatopsis sp. GM8]|uniref:RHS repeat-associated core domain-containing protein n=1 Tax=Amycolatopsis sp. GM8 TaxID=2896530 RepID=UPI001F3C4AA3|nr:RHS repeat-associated core domain-containing protein [Amycolatopsis sp. GM8]